MVNLLSNRAPAKAGALFSFEIISSFKVLIIMTRALVLNVLSTKTIKLMLVSFVFFTLFAAVMPSPARAAELSTAQMQSILSLLQSFGASQSTISKVSAALGTESSTGVPTIEVVGLTKDYIKAPYSNMPSETIVRFQNASTGALIENIGTLIREEGSGTIELPYTGTFYVPSGKYRLRAANYNNQDVVYATSNNFTITQPSSAASSTSPTCKPVSAVDCGVGSKPVSQGTDANGCKLADKCVASSQSAVPTCTLVANKSLVQKGETVTLSWTSKNATSASKTGTTDVAKGSVKVQPTEQMVYKKTFSGPGGSVSCQVKVNISGSGSWQSEKAGQQIVQGAPITAQSLVASVGSGVAALVSTPRDMLAQLFNFQPRNNVKMEQQEKKFRELKERNKQMKAGMASSTMSEQEPKDLEKNNFPGNSACAFLVRNLKRGATGEDVKQFQEYLQTTGDFKEKADGLFNEQTEEALKKIQARYNIVTSGDATTTGFGAVGPRTRQILMAHCKALKEHNEGRKEDRRENASSTRSSVNVNAGAPTCTLTANKSEVAGGEAVTLTWTSTNATYASMPRGERGPANGSLTVTAAETATYQKRVYGPGGEGTCQATVTVTGDTSAPEVKVVRASMLDQMFSTAGQQLAAGITAYFDFFGVSF